MADAMYMNFAEIIKQVSQDKRLVPDLLKAENGNNFRAVSESAILDVIDPVLKQAEVYYTVTIKDQKLDIREAYGSKGKKLQFIATVTVQLAFHFWDGELINCTEAVGMGIDDNDKAMGKAYTYAVKYALLKLFRLRYGDDPDAKASEPLYLDKPKEASKEETKKEAPKSKAVQKSNTDKAMTESQRDYILGMMKQKGVTSQIIMGKFDGYDPQEDEYIPMKVARAMIKYLEETDDLPF